MQQQSIKVMQIIARLNVGGPASHVIWLTEGLHSPGFECLLTCGQISSTEGDMIYLAQSKGVEPIILPRLGREISPFNDLVTIWKLYRLMRKYRPDVVHTHTAKAGFVGRVAAWLARVPVRVHTFHGHVFYGYFGKWKTRLFLWLERLCGRISTRIITISPGLRDELVDTYRVAPVDKFEVVSLGLELAPLVNAPRTPEFRTQYHLPLDAKLVGIVGRLVPIKNHELFLQTAQRIAQQRQDIHFVVIGDGEQRPILEARVRELDLSSFVTFTGWIEDLGSVFKDLGVLALTSDNEGTPVSIIEAMVTGTPVVSTDVGGVSDVLGGGQYGILVPPGNAGALAEAIIRALDGDHSDLEVAQATALDRYDIRQLVEEMGALYRHLLATHRR